MEGFLYQASVYLGAALLVVPLAVRLGLGSVLGYLAAGILIGPGLGLVGSDVKDLQHFAEFGVVLMLFLIGLELEPRTLWDMRHKLLGLGGAQIGLTAAAVTGALVLAGLAWQTALLLGLMLSLSSTAIVLQTLTEKNLMRTPGGRSGFAVLLTQDVAVVPMLALVPLLALAPPSAVKDHGDGAPEAILTFLQGLPGWAGTLVTLGVVLGIVGAGHFLTRPAFRFIHAARLHELSTFFALLIVLGIAFAMTLVGLSPALGTFVAGVVLANSEFRHELEADIKPFKGLLLGLFFMTVGAGIDFGVLAGEPARILGLTLGLMALKLAVLLVLALVFRLKGRDRWLFALSLAQAGEFGFLLTSFAVQQGALPDALAQRALLVIGLSMLFTPLLFLAYDALARRLAEARPDQSPETVDERGRVIIAGIGRFGQVVNRLVRMAGVPTVVLDADMATIDLMRRFGVKGFYGDPSRPEMLAAAGLAEAQVLVVAVNDREAALRIVRHARHARPDLHIVARARDRVNVYELFQAGANDIVRETFDSSVRAGRYVLENTGLTDYEAAMVSQTYYKVDRAALRDLAELWVPGQPVHLNEAYVARARQLDADLETALLDEAERARREGRDPDGLPAP
jgi:CPA2 family monovalent cation:H+ antiporter-2